MKILQLVDESWDSGLTAYALQVAQQLQENGQMVAVGVREGSIAQKQAQERGLVVTPFTSKLSLRRLLSRKWDLVNVHTGRMHTWSILLTKLGAGRKIAVVRTRGDARPLRINFLSKYLYKKTAGVIAASAHIGGQYEEELRLPEGRFDVIYPSVDVDPVFAPPPLHRIGVLGRLDPVKGHAVFLEAAAILAKQNSDFRFLIAGKEAGLSTSLLKNQARELGIENRVEFLGFQPSARDFMRSCTIGVIPSIGSEEISRACLEWMSVGRPVVGTIVGCLPELIEPEETGLLVPPNDGAALAEAISKIAKDPTWTAALGSQARDLAQRKFSKERQLEKTLTLYTNAVDFQKKGN